MLFLKAKRNILIVNNTCNESVDVVYFDQYLGAGHCKHWSKRAFFLNIHLGYSFNFTVVYFCQILLVFKVARPTFWNKAIIYSFLPHFLSFLHQHLAKTSKKYKKQISTSIWSAQYPNAGQNKQQKTLFCSKL